MSTRIRCVSKNREGKELAELGSLSAAGAVAFSDGSELDSEFGVASPSAGIQPDVRQADSASPGVHRTLARRPDARRQGFAGSGPRQHARRSGRRDDQPRHSLDGSNRRAVAFAEYFERCEHRTRWRGTKLRGVNLTAGVCAINFTLTDETLRSFDLHYKSTIRFGATMSTPASPD